MHNTTTPEPIRLDGSTSVLATLRSLMPSRRLGLSEALRIADLQADRLLQLRQVTDVPIPIEVVTELPRIAVYYDDSMPLHAASGSSCWDNDRKTWVISVNPDEPRTRQRFTLMHEYKHIVDHYHPGLGGRLPTTFYGLDPVEYVAEYFAGCVLMPKRWIKAAYYDGIQRVADLAELFDVSVRAMEVRLIQLGIVARSDVTTFLSQPRFRMQPRRARNPRVSQWHPPRVGPPARVTEEIAA